MLVIMEVEVKVEVEMVMEMGVAEEMAEEVRVMVMEAGVQMETETETEVEVETIMEEEPMGGVAWANLQIVCCIAKDLRLSRPMLKFKSSCAPICISLVSVCIAVLPKYASFRLLQVIAMGVGMGEGTTISKKMMTK